MSKLLQDAMHVAGVHRRVLRLPNRDSVLATLCKSQHVHVLRLAARLVRQRLRLPERVLHMSRLPGLMLTRIARALVLRWMITAVCAVALTTATRGATARATPVRDFAHSANSSTGSAETEYCSAAVVSELVTSLVIAFNAGNDRAVDRLVAREPEFQWFSVNASAPAARRLGSRAEDRSTLRGWVRQRHRHHEQLTDLRVAGSRGFGVKLTRKADDVPRSNHVGKGEALCTDGKPRITLLSF